jgi:hypothetical protein
MHARPAEIVPPRCACCGEPLYFNGRDVEAWRVGSQFVCNEFCADGISEKALGIKTEAPLSRPKGPSRFN